ncbi:MAG: DUF4290 domain-containing protein, partial [Saprospiraceae bacterium]
IRHAFTIEDKDERKSYLDSVVNLMQQMHPQSRNVKDSRLKLWSHVVAIAEQYLDIELPEGIELGSRQIKPELIPYPQEVRSFRHYGKNVKTMIEKAKEMEEGPVKEGFVKSIAAYMKEAYRNWHKESNVSDESIKKDLRTMSDGALDLDDDVSIENNLNQRRRYNNNRGRDNDRKNNNGRNNNRNSGRNNNRNNRRR